MKIPRVLIAFTVFFSSFVLANITAGSRLPPTDATSSVDAKVEIVWPHDAQGRPAEVSSTEFVNVEVFLFERGTLDPVPCGFPNQVTLRWSRNIHDPRPGEDFLVPAHDLPDRPASAVGQRTIEQLGDKTLPAWVFNDVPTGFDPLIRGLTTYFFVEVEGVDYRTNVWSHTLDARTNLPDQLHPVSVGGSAPSAVDARIQVVWSHDPLGQERSVAEASLVNIAVDLTEPATVVAEDYYRWTSVGFDFNRPVWLLRSLNNGFLERVKQADQVITVTAATSIVPPVQSISWPPLGVQQCGRVGRPESRNQLLLCRRCGGSDDPHHDLGSWREWADHLPTKGRSESELRAVENAGPARRSDRGSPSPRVTTPSPFERSRIYWV